MIPISFISVALTSFGAFVAMWGVLLDSPRKVINDSIVANDHSTEKEIELALEWRGHAVISNLMHYRNKAILGLIFIFFGFLLNLPYVNKIEIPFYIVLLLMLLAILLSGIIAGYTRKKIIIEAWKSKGCKLYPFQEEILGRSYLEGHKGTTGDNEYLEKVLNNYLNVQKAFDIDISSSKKEEEKWNVEELKEFQSAIDAYFKDICIWYYFHNSVKKIVFAYQ